MKKIMSLILAVLCVTLAALPLSVSAEVAENTKTVYADDIGVEQMISAYIASNPTRENKLEKNGLLLKAAHSRPVGFWLTPDNYDIKNLTEDYTISVNMLSTHYVGDDEASQIVEPNSNNRTWVLFGTGSKSFVPNTGSGDEWKICSNMVATTDPGLKVCYDENSGYYLAFDGVAKTNNPASAAIAEAMITGKSAVVYQFAFDATNKKMTSVTMSLENQTETKITYDFDDVDVGDGNFGFGLREVYGNKKSRFTGIVSELSVKTETETKYSVDFAERYADIQNCRSTVIGGQLSDDNTTVRILSAITMEDTELANYASHGFEISLKDSVNGAQTRTSTKVYTSVSAAGDTVTAVDEKCDFIGAMTVTGLAAGESYTFVVRAFVTDAAGNKYMSAAEEITIDVPES